MDRINAAREWYEVWSKTPDALKALKEFNAIDGDEKSRLITLDRIAMACFNAAHYSPENDDGEIYRALIAKEKKHLNQLQKAAHVLALSAMRNDKALSWAHDIADSSSGVRITRKEHREPKPHHLVMHDYFSALEKALGGQLPELHKGAFLHSRTKGNLLYNKPIKRGNKVGVQTMLAFELSFYMRMYTAGHAKDSIQNGQSIPTHGEPCYSIVGNFCNAVFDLKGVWDAKQIGGNVRDLGTVGFKDW